MSWPKPEISLIASPNKPKRWVWFSVFIALFCITAIFLILSWGNSHYLSSISFWFVLIFVPFVIGSIVLSIRFYLYGLAQERYDIWRQEKENVEHNWQDWAMRGVNIIDSYWMTPNELSATQILFDKQNLPVQVDKVLVFDVHGHEHYFEDLFHSLAVTLNQLPNDLNIAITVYSSSESYCYLDNIIWQAYKHSWIKQRYTFNHVLTDHAQTEKIIQLIDNPQTDIQLLIVNNLSSKGSAFLSALLLVEEQFSSEVDKSMASTALLRPMTTQDITVGIEQMAEMQPAIFSVAQLWCANLDKEQEIDIVKQLAEWEISPKDIYFLDSIAGKQTDLAYWSLLSLSHQLVKKTQQNILIVTTSQGKYVLSVLTSSDLGQVDEE